MPSQLKKLTTLYYSPTSIFWRKIGDALLASSTIVSTYAISNNMNKIALISVLVGAAGKFLTNLFSTKE